MRRIILIIIFSFSLLAEPFYRSTSSSPNRINPLLATDSVSGEISSWIFNGLVKFDKNGKIVGDLATSWKFEDNTTLIFYLKKNVFWHDGKKFSAKDVVFTYNLLRSKKIVTPYATDFKEVQSVEAINDYTIKIKYKKPYFKALSIWMMGILPKHIWEKEKNPMQSRFNKFAIGTGPYKMIKPFEVNKDIVLVANKRYFEHPPYIKKMIYKYVADSATEFMLLKSQKLDIGGLTPLQLTRQIDKNFKKHFNIFEMPSHGYTYIGFNLRKKPFNNKQLRKAIALAINKQELIDLLFFSHAKICNGPFMPGSGVYPKDFKPLKYNPKKAKAILKELGYDSKHPFTFTLVTNSGNPIRIYAAEIIQQQLLKVNVHMKIRVLEWQAFLNTIVFPHRFDAVLLGWGLSLIPDAYSIWHSKSDTKGGFNFIGYHNKKVDKLIIKAQSEINQEKFNKIYQKIFKLIVNDHPYVFLYIPNSITAVSKSIKNVSPSIVGLEYNFIDWVKE